MWLSCIDDDVTKINKGLQDFNKDRREKYQSEITDITKSELVTFIALMIEASINKLQGIKLWNDGKERRKGLAPRIDFSRYMKFWRFSKLKRIIPYMMVDKSLKEEDDEWWRFKGRVGSFNKVRKDVLLTSHVRVFDESMSPYVPR